MRPDGTWEPGEAPSRRHGYYEPEAMPVVGAVTPDDPPSGNRVLDRVDNWLRERTGMGLFDGRPEVPDVIQNPVDAVASGVTGWIETNIIANALRVGYVIIGVILITAAIAVMAKEKS